MTKPTGKTAAKSAAPVETQATQATQQAAQEPQQAKEGTQEQGSEAATLIAGAEQKQDQGQAAAPAAPKAPKAVVVTFGDDAMANGDAAQELVSLKFPLLVEITNEMPRRATFPELKGLLLAHVAGAAELKTKPAVFSNADQLHRFVTDVHSLCVFNGFKDGVTVKAV